MQTRQKADPPGTNKTPETSRTRKKKKSSQANVKRNENQRKQKKQMPLRLIESPPIIIAVSIYPRHTHKRRWPPKHQNIRVRGGPDPSRGKHTACPDKPDHTPKHSKNKRTIAVLRWYEPPFSWCLAQKRVRALMFSAVVAVVAEKRHGLSHHAKEDPENPVARLQECDGFRSPGQEGEKGRDGGKEGERDRDRQGQRQTEGEETAQTERANQLMVRGASVFIRNSRFGGSRSWGFVADEGHEGKQSRTATANTMQCFPSRRPLCA